jgi:hypothetical protein
LKPADGGIDLRSSSKWRKPLLEGTCTEPWALAGTLRRLLKIEGVSVYRRIGGKNSDDHRLPATREMAQEFSELFEPRAYTIQSMRPHPKAAATTNTGRNRGQAESRWRSP